MTSIWNNHNVDIDNLPRVELQDFKGLERPYRWFLVIRNSLFFIMLILGLGFVQPFIETDTPEIYFYIAYAVLSFLLILSVIWAIIAFPKKGFLLRQHDLSYQSGVLQTKMTSIPKNRIQHVELRQGPVLRLLKLSKIVIYTAGGSGSDLSISGLKPSVAEQIKEDLSLSISVESNSKTASL